MKLYKFFGGSNTKIFNNTTHTVKDERPTIYIVSHKFSWFDILVVFELFSQCSNPSSPRVMAGICDVPDWFRILLLLLLNYACPALQLTAYNKRHGNTTQEVAKYLCWGDDLVIWQHPYNKSRGLYYILHKCIYVYGLTPRLVYIDITDHMTKDTLNNESIVNIIRKTRNKTYYATSKEIEYTIEREMTDDVYKYFTEPFWDQVCANPKG